jgi:hypothetical protein
MPFVIEQPIYRSSALAAIQERFDARDLLINDFTPLGSPNWLRMPRILANFWGLGTLEVIVV